MENGIDFKLEYCSKKAGRFIFCMVKSMEGKRFTLCFPKERRLPGGWFVLAKKLRSLGVGSSGSIGSTLRSVFPSAMESGDVLKKATTVSYVEATKKSIIRVGEVVWLQVGAEEAQ